MCEDEILIGIDMQEELERNGWDVLGPFVTPAEAMPWVSDTLLAAVIDPHLRDGRCDKLLARLQSKRVPTVIYSGGAPQEWEQYSVFVTHVTKPAGIFEIASILDRFVSSS